MHKDAEKTETLKFIRSVEIVSEDGSLRKMSEEEAVSFAAALESASEKSEKERPGWEALPIRLGKRHPGLVVESIGGNVPIQGYGRYNEEEFYFRARYQHAELKVGTTHPDPDSLSSDDEDKVRRGFRPLSAVLRYPRLYARIKCSESKYGAGWMTPQQTEVIFTALVSNLGELTHEENEAHQAEEKKYWDEFLAKVRAERDEKESSTDETE